MLRMLLKQRNREQQRQGLDPSIIYLEISISLESHLSRLAYGSQCQTFGLHWSTHAEVNPCKLFQAKVNDTVIWKPQAKEFRMFERQDFISKFQTALAWSRISETGCIDPVTGVALSAYGHMLGLLTYCWSFWSHQKSTIFWVNDFKWYLVQCSSSRKNLRKVTGYRHEWSTSLLAKAHIATTLVKISRFWTSPYRSKAHLHWVCPPLNIALHF